MSIVWQESRRRQAGRERGMPGGPIPSRHNAAPTAFSCQTLRVADLLDEEQRCRRGASLFEDCSLGYASLLAKTKPRCSFWILK
jgi:hypothetical protein